MILITGATGTVGREVVKILARPEARVRAMVRDRGHAASISYPGVDIVAGDFAKVETLDDALSGVKSAFLLPPPDEDMVEQQANFIQAASRSRTLKHIVKLSVLGVSPDSPVRFARWHAESERQIVESGIPYTFIRPNFFMQNILMYRDSIVHDGAIYAPMGDARASYVDVRDLAAVIAAVLSEFGHEWKAYEVTGPEALTYEEMANRLSVALAKPVAYVDITPEQAREAMLKTGMEEWRADALLELYAWAKFGHAAEVSGSVAHIGKRHPTTFLQFAQDYAPQLR